VKSAGNIEKGGRIVRFITSVTFDRWDDCIGLTIIVFVMSFLLVFRSGADDSRVVLLSNSSGCGFSWFE
jgi:hypothetical protein